VGVPPARASSGSLRALGSSPTVLRQGVGYTLQHGGASFASVSCTWQLLKTSPLRLCGVAVLSATFDGVCGHALELRTGYWVARHTNAAGILSRSLQPAWRSCQGRRRPMQLPAVANVACR